MDKKIRSPTCPSQRKKKERKKMNKKRNKEKQGEKGIDSLFPPLRGLNPPIPFTLLLSTQLAGSIQPSLSCPIPHTFHFSAKRESWIFPTYVRSTEVEYLHHPFTFQLETNARSAFVYSLHLSLALQLSSSSSQLLSDVSPTLLAAIILKKFHNS